MRHIARLLVLCLSLLSLPSFAESVANLYQVHEPVASQQPDERNAGLTRALQTLVLRLTGDQKALQHPALASYFQDPQQLISQYGFEDGPPMALVVDFDPNATNAALRRAGLPVWGASRPTVLAWWLNQSSAGNSLVGDNQESATPLNRAAQRRGVPLRLPLADLGEQALTPESLAAPDALRGASERYGADAILAVDAKQDDAGKWQAQWRLWMGDSSEQGQAQGDDANALADSVMQAVSGRLASRFVAAPGAATAMTLQVDGANLARYAELQRLLEPLGARLVQVQGNSLEYRLSASPDQLRAQLELAHLQEMPAEEPQPAADPNAQPAPNPAVPSSSVLRYRWP
ncbi:DUF2066 domain-containing protein [Pseudomonas schmalbachii]|uniref:DUF2066 domain-containing protein n=1 Tax=Pseudomonas schmalbachii TaxID=2816993 RepID=A0ABS3TS41_9PSED|nr:DUF2066 domain-containing protein [Pseudomonas schmalbachii]MBO3276481.1 DUF2066 domain-containing protein [Pseudomonas schmalbachii]